jgi:hypothetical protein
VQQAALQRARSGLPVPCPSLLVLGRCCLDVRPFSSIDTVVKIENVPQIVWIGLRKSAKKQGEKKESIALLAC